LFLDKKSSIFQIFIFILIILVNLSGCSLHPKWKASTLLYKDLISHSKATATRNDLEKILSQKGSPVSGEYRLGPYDEVNVLVWKRPDLGSQISSEDRAQPKISVIQSDGTLLLPPLKPIRVVGLTVEETRNKIAKQYSKLINDPHVAVKIVNYASKPVYIEGAVASPGIVYINPYLNTLEDAIAKVGGLKSYTDVSRVTLKRDNKFYQFPYLNFSKGYEKQQSFSREILLQPKDMFYFPSINDRVVFILGEVSKQVSIPIPPKGLTVLQALAFAGGADVITANYDDIFLVRLSANNENFVYKLSLGEIMSDNNIYMHPRDRLFVSPTALTVWQRAWRQMFPFIGTGAAMGNVAVR